MNAQTEHPFFFRSTGDYVVAINTTDQLQEKTPKRVFSATQLKAVAPNVDWDGELKALSEAHGVENLAPTQAERARILRDNAQRKYRERAERMMGACQIIHLLI